MLHGPPGNGGLRQLLTREARVDAVRRATALRGPRRPSGDQADAGQARQTLRQCRAWPGPSTGGAKKAGGGGQAKCARRAALAGVPR